MKRRFMIAAAVVCFLAAAMATVFPVLSNHYTEKHRSEIRTEYFQTVEALDTSELEAARKAAQEYNVMIANGVIQNNAPFSDGNINSAMQGYTELLNINEGECTPDGKFSLDDCRCVGACGLAPVVTINDDVYGRLTGDLKEVQDILAKYAD